MIVRKGKKDNSWFVRYGGLNLKSRLPKHKRGKSFKGTFAFHSPPTRRGFYAFPIKCIETFLCYHRIEEKQKRREFQYSGLIWHHLGHNTTGTILARSGSWVLTEFSVWEKAFLKESLNNRYGGNSEWIKSNSVNINVRSGVSGWYSKDHYEVFIPEKV